VLAVWPAGLPLGGAPALAGLPAEPLAPPCDCCDGNGDSGPPPWLDDCPLLDPWLDDSPPPAEPPVDGWPALDPCPELGLPPDEEGDGEAGGDCDGEDGLGSCGIEGDWVELVDEQPATRASTQMAGQITCFMVLSCIPDDSRARSLNVRSAAPFSTMIGSGRPPAGSMTAATGRRDRCWLGEVGAHQERA